MCKPVYFDDSFKFSVALYVFMSSLLITVMQTFVNCLHRYDSSTGTFTVPPGGEGFYYFSAYFVVWYYKVAHFDIQINGETLCTARGDRSESYSTDTGHTSCSTTTFATEGKKESPKGVDLLTPKSK